MILILDFVFTAYKAIRKPKVIVREPLTRLEREVILGAMDTYQQIIVRGHKAFTYDLDVISDFVKGIDNLKDKINVPDR